MNRWRYGERWYTTEEIREIGRRHGEDGIEFYPPSLWVVRELEPTRFMGFTWPTAKQSYANYVPLHSGPSIDGVYHDGYQEGGRHRYA